MKKVISFFHTLAVVLYTLIVFFLLVPGLVLAIPLFLLAFSDAEMKRIYEEADLPPKE